MIDADVLARAGEVFTLTPLRVPAPEQLALRRVCTRRGAVVIDANRYLRRLIFAGSVGVPGRVECLRRVATHG